MTSGQTGTRTLWTGGPQIGPVSLGGAPFGGLYRPMDQGEVDAIVAAAWAAGVRYFDTAPGYGNGVSEQRLGTALGSYPREEFVLSTKVGWLIDNGFRIPAFDAIGIARSLDESQERLQLDRVDIAYLHDPDEYADLAIAESIPALAELRRRGAVAAIGLGVNWPALPVRLLKAQPVDLVMLAGRYTLLDRSAGDELVPLCAELGVRIVAAAVFNSGILADPSPGARFDYVPASDQMLARAQRLQQITRRHGGELAAAAVQFPLRSPVVSTVVLGASSPQEIIQDVALAAAHLPEELWPELLAF